MFWLLTVLWAAGLLLSSFGPSDRLTWVMEVLPAVIAWPILFYLRPRFRFTDFAMALIALHGLILMLGGAYTYARVPMGFWLQDWLSLERNPYDRIGHLAQGFVPAIVAREVLIRVFRIEGCRLVGFLAVCICLAISAVYELIEWAAALSLGGGADEFLGTQGDEWDTQSDMFMALVGALAALALSRWHDRRMQAIGR
jgi:putative membrane protein